MVLSFYHLIALTIGFALDLIVGDPRSLPHPVRLIGRLIAALERAGVFAAEPRPRSEITPLHLYECGLTGTPDCTARRRALLEAMGLPPRLSVKGLCEVLATVTDPAELPEYIGRYLPEEAAT